MNKDIKDIENIERFCKLFEEYKSFLTQVQLQAFQLYFFENLSYSEIAEITATTRSAAYDSVNKAIKKLLKIEEKMK
ncbi:UNVERIFIED_CONTAM: sigma factor-like helix-turn-helix DNA-binding protein [Campylobacter lari]